MRSKNRDATGDTVKPPAVTHTDIPGLLVVDLHLVEDSRGWFKEGWQREKMTAAGLPDFGPVQHNLSFNAKAGVTRGFHAEPWDKFVSVATGAVYGAWVDLRQGAAFGRIFTLEIHPGVAVYVPRGVGNAYQALEDSTCYTYLVNQHWSADSKERYTFANLDLAGVQWPIPLSRATLSEADLHHPPLSTVTPVPPAAPLIVGADGQLGRALQHAIPDGTFATRQDLDISDPLAVQNFNYGDVSAIINAAAFTDVDGAEGQFRSAAWQVNADGPRHLVAAARHHRLPLVHISSDYVFDGSHQIHDEDELPSPLSSYGASKAAGDAVVATWAQHYILRTSWVVGDGPNFVRTMARLAAEGHSPSVVNDQYGRPTFADDLARAIVHLLERQLPFGVYNVTSDGPTMSWYEIAAIIFDTLGSLGSVSPITTADYASERRMAPRPIYSTLDLRKIKATGFDPTDGRQALLDYLTS